MEGDVDGWAEGVSSSSEASSIPVCLTTAICCQPAISASIIALGAPAGIWAVTENAFSWAGGGWRLMSPGQEKENESADANIQITPCCSARGRLGPLLFADSRSAVGDKCRRLSVEVFVLIVSLLFCSQPASPEPSNPNWETDLAPPARPTVTAARGEPASVPARAASTGPTATPPSPSAPVSHGPAGLEKHLCLFELHDGEMAYPPCS